MVTKRAYIYIAINDSAFCVAAKDVVELLTRNFFRMVVLDGVANVVLFMGKMGIVTIMGVVGMGILKAIAASDPAISVSAKKSGAPLVCFGVL